MEVRMLEVLRAHMCKTAQITTPIERSARHQWHEQTYLSHENPLYVQVSTKGVSTTAEKSVPRLNQANFPAPSLYTLLGELEDPGRNLFLFGSTAKYVCLLCARCSLY